MKGDIKDRQDIRKVVSTFYQNLLADEEFHHIFFEVAEVDIISHMDVLIDFWESVLFQAGKYKGDVLYTHIDLNQKYNYGLRGSHFDHWLEVFNTTVDELYEGPIATGAKERARSLATIIKLKIDDLEKMRLEINN